MEAFYFLGFIQAFRCLLAFQAALLSEGYSFLRPYPNFISYLYVSQPLPETGHNIHSPGSMFSLSHSLLSPSLCLRVDKA